MTALPEPAGLKQNALGLVQSVVIGVAGTAPAYSMAATLVALFTAVGELAPATLACGAVIMLGITLAYVHLNRIEPNAGATYAWVSRVFNPALGFLAGWALLVSSVVFMVSATLPAASATLLLVHPGLESNTHAVTVTAVAWLLLVTVVLVLGVSLTGAVQTVMTSIELALLAVLIGLALVKLGGQGAHRIPWSILSPAAFSPDSFSQGVVIGVFFFWGWDVALNLNEETREGARTPGRGALLAMLVITAAFIGFSTITLGLLSDEEIHQGGTNIVFAVADRLLPRPWSYVGVLVLMLSTVGTLETNILQFSRTVFANARDGVLPRSLAAVHSRWHTPYRATLLISLLGTVLLAGVLLFPDTGRALTSSIDAISVQVAFYYGLAGLACAWWFRGVTGVLRVVTRVLWPAASALVLWASALIALRGFDRSTAIFTISGLLLGFVPLALRRRAESDGRGIPPDGTSVPPPMRRR